MKKPNNKLNFSIDRSAWVNEKYLPKEELDLKIEDISRNGYTILENRMNPKDIEYAIKKVDEVYESQLKDCGGEKTLIEIGEQGLARNLLQYDEFFLKLITHKEILSLMKHFLGGYYTLYTFNGNLNIPNLPATSTPWHRDLAFEHFTSSRPISLTTIWVLDEFNETNNGISILPSTQKHDIFPSFEYVEKYQSKIFAKAGSVIVLDGMLFHRSGLNNSNKRRRTLQGMYTLPIIEQQICIPQTLKGKYKDDSFLRQLLGYNNKQQPSVLEWRKGKLENKRNLKDSMIKS